MCEPIRHGKREGACGTRSWADSPWKHRGELPGRRRETNRPDPSPWCETGKGNRSTLLKEAEVLLEHRDLLVRR
jgi:hypothetical protein